jgi:hypothetical protein
MTQKIGLISDVHATPAPVQEAFEIFKEQGVDRIFCAGDIAGYGDGLAETISLIEESGSRSTLSLPDMTCQVVPLSGKDSVRVWNWGYSEQMDNNK